MKEKEKSWDVHHSMLRLSWYQRLRLSHDCIRDATSACEEVLSGVVDDRSL